MIRKAIASWTFADFQWKRPFHNLKFSWIKQLSAKKQDPLVITVQNNGDVFIGETKVAMDEIAAKLKGIAKNGYDDTIFVKGDRGANYGAVLKVMGRIVEGGFTKVSFVSELEQGG